MATARPDFTGYATKYGIKCTDGRTIRHKAFQDSDGKTVPLVWQHNYDTPDNVIGHADLHERNDGVYIEGYFNDSRYGQQSKTIVHNRDVNALSICANHVIEKDGFVMHGNIKEVSLVLSGANPEAVIENIIFQHADGSLERINDEAIIYSTSELSDFSISHEDNNANEESEKAEEGTESKEIEMDKTIETNVVEESDISHSDDSRTLADIYDNMSDEKKGAILFLMAKAAEEAGAGESSEAAQSDDDEDSFEHADGGKTIGSIIDTMTDEEQDVMIYLIAQATEEAKNIKHSDEGGNDTMKYNVFENQEIEHVNEFTHADFNEILAEAKTDKVNSLKDVVIKHADDDYGIENIGYLFPDAELVNKKIELIRNNPTDWVAKVMSRVHKSPFSRIKMMTADITADTARARGYVKGNKKLTEVLSLAKREVSPTTIYKLQKLDRDDIIDVTTIDVVAWLKAEMRIMIEEEIARAIIVGDQRDPLDTTNKIDEDKIIPILKDYASDLYAVRHYYEVAQDENEYVKFIDECTLAMMDYEGSGAPSLFIEPLTLARCLLIKDSLGHRLYKTRDELAGAIGVKDIIEVPYMKNREYTDADSQTQQTMVIPAGNAGEDNMIVKGIIVNLADYTYGADKGGALNMFDDFDIDFNQYKYLMETRASGALTKPHSALLIGEIAEG